MKEHLKDVKMNAKLHLNLTVQKHWDIMCLFVHFFFVFTFFLSSFRSLFIWSDVVFCSAALMAQSVGVFLSWARLWCLCYYTLLFAFLTVTLFIHVTKTLGERERLERTALYSMLENRFQFIVFIGVSIFYIHTFSTKTLTYAANCKWETSIRIIW